MVGKKIYFDLFIGKATGLPNELAFDTYCTYDINYKNETTNFVTP